MKKKLTVIITLIAATFLLTACGGPNKSTSKSSSNDTVKTSKKSSKDNSKKDKNDKNDQQKEFVNLIGTWQTTDNNSISFANDGSYTLSTEAGNRAGTFSVAGQYDQTMILKMTNYDENTPGLETYVTFKLNKDKTLNFGTHTGFKALSKLTKIPTKLFMTNYLTKAPTTVSEKVIGTWTNQGSGAHTYVTSSYNPDGTFESFSDASGFVSKGRYSVTGDENKIEITSTRDNQESIKTTYTMSKDFTVMTQNEPGIVFTYHKI